MADNGTQFRNLIGTLSTKYSRLLEHLGIEPIFAKPHHSQTKGKLERWFSTVRKMFLVEERYYTKRNSYIPSKGSNQQFHEWFVWYKAEKSHRSLPDRFLPKRSICI